MCFVFLQLVIKLNLSCNHFLHIQDELHRSEGSGDVICENMLEKE
ncbi:hypothetical protein HanRHA438_Chr10g0458961 [Helianthus annuus]|nr:hypothetical protein HanRHA438_Chr10g0458961 [Helianthus annuus]